MEDRPLSVTQLRVLTSIALTLLAAGYLLPVLMPEDERRTQVLLGMTGYGSVLSWPVIRFVSTTLLVGQVIALLGLWMLARWSRWVLLLSILGGAVLALFSGISVGTPLAVVLGFLSALVNGALLTIAFNVRVDRPL